MQNPEEIIQFLGLAPKPQSAAVEGGTFKVSWPGKESVIQISILDDLLTEWGYKRDGSFHPTITDLIKALGEYKIAESLEKNEDPRNYLFGKKDFTKEDGSLMTAQAALDMLEERGRKLHEGHQ